MCVYIYIHMQSVEVRQKVSKVYSLHKNTLLHFCLSLKLGSQRVCWVLFQLSTVKCLQREFQKELRGEADVDYMQHVIMCNPHVGMWITSNKEFKLVASNFTFLIILSYGQFFATSLTKQPGCEFYRLPLESRAGQQQCLVVLDSLNAQPLTWVRTKFQVAHQIHMR